MSKSISPATKSLRKAVDQATGPADGTIVRFVHVAESSSKNIEGRIVNSRPRALTYAALFIKGNWYLTGATSDRARRPMTHRSFVEFLASPMVHTIETATEFEWVD